MNVALVAEEAAGVRVLRALAETEHAIVGVFTSAPATGDRATVWHAAETLGLPVRPTEQVREAATAAWLRDRRVDLLLNIHSLYVAPESVVEAPGIGSFNLHPGPLPHYAGLNAPSWAIYRGERTHGVTLHWMDSGIDTGPIAYASTFPIEPDDTGLVVATRCAREGVALVARLVETAASAPETIPRFAQRREQREYFGAGVPDEGRIAWHRPAAQLADFVRACDYEPFVSPWGHPRTVLRGSMLEVLKAAAEPGASTEAPGTVVSVAEGRAHVATGDGVLALQRVRVDGVGREAGDVLVRGDVLRSGL